MQSMKATYEDGKIIPLDGMELPAGKKMLF